MKARSKVSTTATVKKTINTVTETSKTINKIIIPEGMTKKQAAEDLMNQWNNEEQFQQFQIILDGWDWKDGLRAFRNVIEDKFGWLKGGKGGWFTPPPSEITITTGYKNGEPILESAFYGPCKFPVFEDAEGQIGVSGGHATCSIKAKKKFSLQINTFFKEVEQYIQNNSIYRNKPVVVTYDEYNDRLDLNITEIHGNDRIILNEDEYLVIDNFVVGQLNEPGKRTYLFSGPYGNGKSETAMNIAVEALKRGVSFFYLKDTRAFNKLLVFAKKYEPCIVFCEDIDEITTGEDRDANINQILNTIDGVETKGRNITTIFTTNHEDRINPALRRPGRIDLIVNFQNPNKVTKERILRLYLEKLKGHESVDYELVVNQMEDTSGATVAEIAKRAVRLAQQHNNEITTDRVLACIKSMAYQIQFMKGSVTDVNPLKKSLETLRDFMTLGVEG